MQKRSTMLLVAATVLLLAAGSAKADGEYDYSHCEPCKKSYGYYPLYYPGQNSCPMCVRSANLACPKLGPVCCNGPSGKKCPAVACTYSASYAVSGSRGCARAQSFISAYAISKETNNYYPFYKEVMKDYCSYPYTDNIKAVVKKAVNVYAEAVAKTLIQYTTYVCECAPKPGYGCKYNYKDCSSAYTVVKSSVQSVAKAHAEAYAEAIATVSDCFKGYAGDLLAYSSAIAESMAEDTALAIDYVYKAAISEDDDDNCKHKATEYEVSKAVAKAVACTFVKVLAEARDAHTPGNAYSCSATLAIAGETEYGKWETKCPVTMECPEEKKGEEGKGEKKD